MISIRRRHPHISGDHQRAAKLAEDAREASEAAGGQGVAAVVRIAGATRAVGNHTTRVMHGHLAVTKDAFMAAARMASDGKDRRALQVALRRLRDEIIELYLDWREEAALVADTYAVWADAPADDKGWCFAAYSAAIDREDAAARRYADVVLSGERLSHRWKAR